MHDPENLFRCYYLAISCHGTCKLNVIQKHLGCKKSKAKPEAAVLLLFLIVQILKCVISGRGQGILRFYHSMQLFIIMWTQTAAIYAVIN